MSTPLLSSLLGKSHTARSAQQRDAKSWYCLGCVPSGPEQTVSFTFDAPESLAAYIAFNITVPHYKQGNNFTLIGTEIPSSPAFVFRGQEATRLDYVLTPAFWQRNGVDESSGWIVQYSGATPVLSDARSFWNNTGVGITMLFHQNSVVFVVDDEDKQTTLNILSQLAALVGGVITCCGLLLVFIEWLEEKLLAMEKEMNPCA